MPIKPQVITVCVDGTQGEDDPCGFDVAVRYTGVDDEESGLYGSECDDSYPALLNAIDTGDGDEFQKARDGITKKFGDGWTWSGDVEPDRDLTEEEFRSFKGPRLTVDLGQAKAQ